MLISLSFGGGVFGVKLTAKDICEVTGWSRDQLRALLDELPPYREWKSAARVARRFSPTDLLFLSVVAHLEQSAGLRRSAIARISTPLKELLSRVTILTSPEVIFVSLTPPKAVAIQGALPAECGIVIRLAPIARKLHEYFGLHIVGGTEKQVALKLGPTVLSRRSA